MPVIAMTREMGSLGKDVARGLAKRLNLELIQHELVSSVADKMKIQESAVSRYLEGKSTRVERGGISDNRLSLFTSEEILEVASRGNVLVRGWGAAYVLREIPHVLSVRVCAPAEYRARVLMERIGITDFDIAMREIEHNDAAHAQTMQRLFSVDWRDPNLYDLVLNRQRLSVEGCIDIIIHTLEQPTFQETKESRQLLEAKTIEARIYSALKQNDVTNRPSPYFEIKLQLATGDVLLTGVVPDEEFRLEAGRIAASIPGVKRVSNDLMPMRTSAEKDRISAQAKAALKSINETASQP